MTAAGLPSGAEGSVVGPVTDGEPAPEAVVDELQGAVRSLDGLDGRPVGEHVAYFDALHAALQNALASIDGV